MGAVHGRAPSAPWILGTILLAMAIGPADAHAYLDPGTGSMVLQVIVGGVMASLFVIRRRWDQLKGYFRRRSRAADERPASGSERDPD